MKLGITLAVLLLLYLCRVPILRGLGNFLVSEDRPEKCDALFILGGNGYERALEAARVMENTGTPAAYCTGANVPTPFRLLNINLSEARSTAKFLKTKTQSRVYSLEAGTSTMEEALAIKQFCARKNIKKIMVLSSRFHTRRMRRVFRQAFADSKIQVLIVGCPPAAYNTKTWWHSEEGLLMVNNEYVKLLYYWWKY